MQVLKPFIFLLLFFLSSKSWANNCVSDSLPSKISIEIHFAPGFTSRQLSVDTSVKNMDNYHYTRQWVEHGKFGYQCSVDLCYEITKFFSCQVGVGYTERGYQMKARSWFDKTGIYQLGTADVKYELRFIGIPISFNLFKSFQHFKLIGSVGISLDYLFQNRIASDITYYDYYNLENEKISFDRKDEPFFWNVPIWKLSDSKFNVSGQLALGIEVDLTNKLSLNMAPKISRTFLSIFQNPIQEFNYNIGLNFGLKYHF